MAAIRGALSLLLVGSGASQSTADLNNASSTVVTNRTSQRDTGPQDRTRVLEKCDDCESRVEKGRWLFCLMNMPASQVTTQTLWNDFKAIDQNGWSFVRGDIRDQGSSDRMSSKNRTILSLSIEQTTPSACLLPETIGVRALKLILLGFEDSPKPIPSG